MTTNNEAVARAFIRERTGFAILDAWEVWDHTIWREHVVIVVTRDPRGDVRSYTVFGFDLLALRWTR